MDKRGGGAARVTINSVFDLPEHPGHKWSEDQSVNLVALNEAMNRLEELDPEKCRVVELRYLLGLSVEETAAALDLSVSTVVRHWRTARAFLYRILKQEESNDGQAAVETD